MTSDHRTPEEIERDIARERAQMTGTINDLQQKFSVDAIVNDIGSIFREQGGELSRSISQTVGRNPAAVALVGVGLAWLFIGQNRKDDSYDYGSERRLGSGGYAPGYSRASSWGGSGQGSWYESDRSWYGSGPRPRADRFTGQGTHYGGSQEGSEGVTDRVKHAASAASEAVSGAASDLGDSARRASDWLAQGTEDLSEEARQRVVAARRVAHEARLSAEDAMRKGRRTAINFFEEQPLVVGALAAAVGAALAGALPRTSLEDDAMGEESDRLFAEAEQVFREEREKAMAVLRSAAKDARDEVKDAGSDLADHLLPEDRKVSEVITDRAEQAASRVAEGARDEAEARNLGQPKR